MKKPMTNSKRTTTAKIVHDHDDFEAGGPGVVQFAYHGSQPASLLIKCPGCGQPSALPLDTTKKPSWQLVSMAPLTLAPSIHHNAGESPCGWHGYLRAGIFRPC